MPRWGLLELIVETLGGDTDEFHQLWLAASRTTVAPDSIAPAPIQPATPRELPADVAEFTGGQEQLAQLDAMLASAHGQSSAIPIAALSGTAGVGKTALAVHWAHRVAGQFPDGQLYLNLPGYDPGAPLQPAQALDWLLRELGVEGGAIPPELAQRAARYRTMTAGRRLIMLLDSRTGRR